MAVRSSSIVEIKTWRDHCHISTWTGLLNGDSGDPILMPGSSVRSIQFSGTFGAGGTIVLQGSNDNSNWFTLTDFQGNAISKTSAALENVEELTLYVRPNVTAGDGTTSLTAVMLLGR